MLKYLSCQFQDKLPYHIQGVNSNDTLYKDDGFKAAIKTAVKDLKDNIEELYKEISDSPI